MYGNYVVYLPSEITQQERLWMEIHDKEHEKSMDPNSRDENWDRTFDIFLSQMLKEDYI